MKRVKNYRSDFLFPKMNMVIGAGSIFNLAGKYFTFNYSDKPDEIAIRNDWGMISKDLNKTMQENPIKTFLVESND